MGAYRLISTAMSRIGKPISRLEDILAYLNAEPPGGTGPARASMAAPGPGPEPGAREEMASPVYAGQPISIEGDEVIFDRSPRLTRRMDFAPDDLGYLVNGEGLVLMGQPLESADLSRGLRLQPIRLDDSTIMPPRATTVIRYKANLPRNPLSHVGMPGGGDAGCAPAPDTPDHADDLARNALSGGEITVHDATGRHLLLRLKWLKCMAGEAGAAEGWRLLYRVVGDGLTTGAAARHWQIADAVFTFDQRGRLDQDIDLALDLGRNLDPVEIDFGRGGLTEFPDGTGLVKILACSQNGWPAAALRDVAVRTDGRVLGCFDNGRVDMLALAAFADERHSRPLRDAA